MRLDFTWSFPWPALILAGVLAATAGCSSSSDKLAGSSAAGTAAAPADSAEKPAEPAKSSETPATAPPDSNDMPIPTTPVRPH